MICPNRAGPIIHHHHGRLVKPLGGATGPFGGHATLGDVASYWKMDEESGVRVDKVGSNDLTDNNTVLYTAGKDGNAARFVEARTEYLSRSWTVTEASFTWVLWVQLTPAEYALLQLNVNGTANYTQTAYIDTNSGGRLLHTIYDSTAGTSTAHVTGVGSGQFWAQVAIGYDTSTKKAFSSVDGGATSEGGALTNGIKTIGNTLWLARNAGGWYADIDLDMLGHWSRRLTDGEISDLYAGGDGLAY